MKFGRATNTDTCELEMQVEMCKWLKEKELSFVDELRVKEVHRIADFIVIKDGSKLINIEAKGVDFICLMKQMKDHAVYCDYSFAFIPDFAITPKHFKENLLKNGYGLIIYNDEKKIITEVLEAHYNKPSNKTLRKSIFKRVREKQQEIFQQQ